MKKYFFAWSQLGAFGVILTMQLEPPKICIYAQGGAPRRAAAKRSTPIGAVSCVASYNEGQVRACDMHATCLHSVLRSVQQGEEG